MKAILQFLKATLLGGIVIVIPAYVCALLVLKTFMAMSSAVEPIGAQLPAGTHYRTILAVLVLLAACFVAGLLVRTAIGRLVRQLVERNLLERIPGYSVFRGLAENITEAKSGGEYRAALVVIEDALVPAFIVERHPGGACTVFVPSAPTPAMGTIYILPVDRVCELSCPLVQVVSCITKWGAGCRELVPHMAALRPGETRHPVIEAAARSSCALAPAAG